MRRRHRNIRNSLIGALIVIACGAAGFAWARSLIDILKGL